MFCRTLWNISLCSMWNEINPLTPAGISLAESEFHTRSAFHKSLKGFISLRSVLKGTTHTMVPVCPTLYTASEFRTLKREKFRAWQTKSRNHKWSRSHLLIENRTKGETKHFAKRSLLLQNNSSSPRSISIVQLNTLLCLHLRPIKLVVYKWPYSFKMMGYLILRHVSRLDAFSVYHVRTRLPGYALGRTTDAPEVRPTRSSRTKVSSSQISNAHDR